MKCKKPMNRHIFGVFIKIIFSCIECQIISITIRLDLMKDWKIMTILRKINTDNPKGIPKGFFTTMFFFCLSFAFYNGIDVHGGASLDALTTFNFTA